MQVLIAEELGFCFGVRDALAVARSIDDAHTVTVHGELVHNEAVLHELDARGFLRQREDARAVPPTPRVLVTAHGISERERARLLAAGKVLIDTTCPLVTRAHVAAQELARDGRFVVVLGKRDHVEVRGIVEDLAACAVVERDSEVETWPSQRLGVVCQTTLPSHLAQARLAAIRARNATADVRFVDTVCDPTKRRMRAVAALAPRVDAFVVVGGRNSNNTRQLAELAAAQGVRTLHVQGAADLDPSWFRGCRVVGLGAGTSTLDATIAAVRDKLEQITA
ncbi:MAG: 4-hydroxy-3-methylbut-2-enyl diphosphate reductase [Planctomycetota bacterium]